MSTLRGRAQEWLQEHGSGFWRSYPELEGDLGDAFLWDEDAAYTALCEHLDLDPDDPSVADEVFPIIASYAEDYT